MADRTLIADALSAILWLERRMPVAYKNTNGKVVVAGLPELIAKLEAAQGQDVEPVAVVGDQFALFWAGSGPIAPLIERHGLKVGSKLYASPIVIRQPALPLALKTHGAWDGLEGLDELPDGTEIYAHPPSAQTETPVDDKANPRFMAGYAAGLKDGQYSTKADHAAAPDDATERALTELVDKIVPGLDTGDLVADAATASKALDRVRPSGNAGELPDPVAWMTHHDEPMVFLSASECAHYCDEGEVPIPLVVGIQAEDYAAARVRAALVAQARPTDDQLWEQTLSERDEYHDMADKLANAIADHLLVEIGEHTSSNCPWMRALDAIENAAQASGRDTTCWCATCNPLPVRMILCPNCSDKRCPRASNHRNQCAARVAAKGE